MESFSGKFMLMVEQYSAFMKQAELGDRTEEECRNLWLSIRNFVASLDQKIEHLETRRNLYNHGYKDACDEFKQDALRYKHLRANYLWDDGNGEMILRSGLGSNKAPNHSDIDSSIDRDMTF